MKAQAITQAIQRVEGLVHRTIPPGQHRFQADVETVHNLMEQEFYEVERFSDRDEFIAKADHYQLFFNLARSNSAKEDKTPWELITQKHPAASPFLPLLSVQYLDELHDAVLHSPAAGGYDVWGLACGLGALECPGMHRICKAFVKEVESELESILGLPLPLPGTMYPVPVRQARVVVIAAFRFHLTMDTLARTDDSGHFGP